MNCCVFSVSRRTKIATNSKDWEERNRALRNEKDIMSRHYQALKSTMDRFRAGQSDRLKTLSLSRCPLLSFLFSPSPSCPHIAPPPPPHPPSNGDECLQLTPSFVSLCVVPLPPCLRSGNAEKDLGSKQELAEQILKLAELCRKMETEQEKVLPFLPTLPQPNDEEGEMKGEWLRRSSFSLPPPPPPSPG